MRGIAIVGFLPLFQTWKTCRPRTICLRRQRDAEAIKVALQHGSDRLDASQLTVPLRPARKEHPDILSYAISRGIKRQSSMGYIQGKAMRAMDAKFINERPGAEDAKSGEVRQERQLRREDL